MDEKHRVLGDAEYFNQNLIHPTALGVLCVLAFAIMLLPRRYVITALLIFASFIPQGQRIVIMTVDFNFIKILLMVGWARILIRSEYRSIQWQPIDRWFAAWILVALAIYPINHGGLASLLPRLATITEAFGAYYLTRVLIRDLEDVKSLVNDMALISIPVLGFFLYEQATHRNLFSVFGGVPEMTVMRQGKFRCQGAYAHPILAGCYWSAIFPLFIGRLFSSGIGRYLAAVGVFVSLAIIAMCNSSTPVMGVLAALFGFACIGVRHSLSAVRWATVLSLVCLHLSMNSPVWHLMNTDFIGGSTGWHRANVLDQFFGHASEWLVFGVGNFTHWKIFMNDLTNNYVVEGVNGGIVALALFVMVHREGFRSVGARWRRVERDNAQFMMIWAIGVSLFVHSVNIFGVTYFGQITTLWYIGFALTAVSTTKQRWGGDLYMSRMLVREPASKVVSRSQLQG